MPHSRPYRSDNPGNPARLNPFEAALRYASAACPPLLLVAVCLLFGAGRTSAQNVQQTRNTVDEAFKSDLRIDPSTLGLNLNIPLDSYAGRAGLSVPVGLRYSSKGLWTMEYAGFYHEGSCCAPSFTANPQGQPSDDQYTYVSVSYGQEAGQSFGPGWEGAFHPPFILPGPSVGIYNAAGDPCNACEPNERLYVQRLRVRMPDGSTHELRRGDGTYLHGSLPTGLGTYLSVDGSRLRYVETAEAAGTLYFPDGSRFLIGNQTQQYIDRNGNRLSYNNASGAWTDTLGRVVGLALSNNPSTPTADRIYTLKGFGGEQRHFTFRYRYLADLLGQATPPTAGDMNTHGQGSYPGLFRSAGGTRVTPPATFNPVVLTEIVLPDGRKYQFGYNEFGELDRVVYPTGGYERFLYAVIPGIDPVNEPYAQTNRGVVSRWVSPTGAAVDELHTRYEVTAGTNYVVKAINPDDTYMERLLHRGRGPEVIDFGFDDARAGLTKDERAYSATGQMLRRTLTQWEQSGPQPGGSLTATRDPRVTRVTELFLDAGGVTALAKTTTYEHDADLNVRLVTEHDFIGVSQSIAMSGGIESIPPGTVLRKTETTYLVNDPSVDAGRRNAYRARDLLSLPTLTLVRDAAGAVVARTELRYDEANYYLSSYGPVTGWTDPSTLVRGNPTTVRSYAVASSSVAPNLACPAGVCVETHTEYDLPGSVTGTWDANGNKTTLHYSPAHAYAYATSVTTAAPNPSSVSNPDGGAAYAAGTFGSTTGLTSHTAYDPDTGLVISTTDANNRTTTYDYNDPLNRLKTIERHDGGRTDYEYGDTVGNLYVRTLTSLEGARKVESKQYFDGLGRAYRTATFESAVAAEPWLYVDTQYDALGRVSAVSAPYRSNRGALPLSAAEWSGMKRTVNEYDSLGRLLKVTTPDGAAVTTQYVGNAVTVTDPSGRKRRSVSDALGRLVRVDEPDAASGVLDSGGNPLQPTFYTYDVLGNLRKVEQGGQKRLFMYDSLSRLIRVRNPEQATHSRLTHTDALNDALTGNNNLWSIGYGYDASGNLVNRIDARNVETSYAYDRLNRNILVSYSGGTPDTPTILRRYDSALNGKGRLYLTQQSGSVTSATYFDEYDVLGRPLVMRQKFETAGVWSLDYKVTRTYDLAGNVRTQTYPSGHTVRYNYDAAGRVGDNPAESSPQAFTGNLGDGVMRAYAEQIRYGLFGGVEQERFGTHTPLYHKRQYNRRGQLFDIRLSTHSLQSNKWDWNRGAIVNYYSSNYAWEGNPATPAGPDNNGNLLMQQTSVPRDDAISETNLSEQRYAYDYLNRLTSVTEQKRDCEACPRVNTFTQAYTYDRWGNRTINAVETKVHEQNVNYNVPEPQFDLSPAGDFREVAEPSNRLYAAGDNARLPQHKLMRYDAAGNLVQDLHTGLGERVYDAENRMTEAVTDTSGNRAFYTYDADGRRARRKVGSEEWWQVYGIDGELLAEYRAGAATFLPSKEYGYRGGELLVTMASGDDLRLRRFVQNLYYGALRRDPTAQELQVRTNELAAAGVQGQTQLLQKAKEVARALFTQTSYETSPHRTDGQYVADLYYAYLQRAPDDLGLAHWTGAAAGGVTNRSNVCDAFEVSPEFAAVASTLYGTSATDDERAEQFINRFYLGATGAPATPAQLQQRRSQLNAAAAQGADAVRAAAEALGRELFAAQVTNLSLPAEQFVTNLYEGFLQRGPDTQGLLNWTAAAGTTTQSRQSVLDAFAICPPFRELAGTLHRETFWLVTDQLGTPRMIVDRTGSLAGVKRHDYLPFGEELYAGSGGRTTNQGYSQPDELRQKWAQLERDNETGLDYARARFYSSTQGRFTSVDPLDPVLGRQGANDKHAAEKQFKGYLSQPQRWNRYAYCLNNPLRYIDPDGFDPFTVNINIIFDKGRYTEEEKRQFRETYIAQLQQDFAHIDIQFNVSYNEGTASNTANHNRHEMTSGVVQGAINVFATPGSVGPAPEVTSYQKGEIWLNTSGNANPGNLTHGVIHALGVAGGVNGYDSPANTSSNRYYLILSELGTRITGNSAESAAQTMQDHLRRLSTGAYAAALVGPRTAQTMAGVSVPPLLTKPDVSTQTRVLREGAQRYLKK